MTAIVFLAGKTKKGEKKFFRYRMGVDKVQWCG